MSLSQSDLDPSSVKSSILPSDMREDDCFLNIVAADLDSFCTRSEFPGKGQDNLINPGVIVFPSVDCRRRKLIHALISQRYQSLAHASIGVEPDRRLVAVYRDYLLKILLPTRFKQIQSGNSMAYSEFAFYLGLLEACRETSEAKRLIERLYAFRLANPKLEGSRTTLRHNSMPEPEVSNSSPSSSQSKGKPVKRGCEIYVPKPMRLLQEQQRKDSVIAGNSGNTDANSAPPLPSSPSLEKLNAEIAKIRLSISPNQSPEHEHRRMTISVITPVPPKPKGNDPYDSNAISKSEDRSQNFDPIFGTLQFLDEFIGRSARVVHIPAERYSAFKSDPPPLDYDALSHVLEISGFPKEWRGSDILRFLPPGTFIHWVSDTCILAVFKSIADAKSYMPPPEVCLRMEVCAIQNASMESKCKAYRVFDDLISRLRKPQTSSVVVKRVLNHHLKLGLHKHKSDSNPPATTNGNGEKTAPLIIGAARDT